MKFKMKAKKVNVKAVKKSDESNEAQFMKNRRLIYKMYPKATIATTVNNTAMRRAVFEVIAKTTKLSSKRVKNVLMDFFKYQSNNICPLHFIKEGPYDCPLFKKQCKKLPNNNFEDCPLVMKVHKEFNIQTWLVIMLIAYHAKVQHIVKRGFNISI